MDYRFIRPLFEADDTDNARDFLINHMLNDDTVGIMEQTDDGSSTVVGIQDIPKESMSAILTHVIDNMYGVNINLMANYLVVQQSINEIYKESILKYLDYCGVKAKFIDIIPTQIIPIVIAMRSRSEGFEPLSRLNPNIHWNPNADYLKNNMDLSNPLSSYFHSYLVIENFSNAEFLKSVVDKDAYNVKFGNMDLVDNPLKNVCLQVLPCSNFDIIYDIVTNIHKYF